MGRNQTDLTAQQWYDKTQAAWEQKRLEGYVDHKKGKPAPPELLEAIWAGKAASVPKFRRCEIATCLADRVNTEPCEQLKSLTITLPPNIMENAHVRTKNRSLLYLINLANGNT